MGKPFSPERLNASRRMRKARRLFKKQPLFAFALMEAEYPGYGYAEFLDDLRYRRPPKKRSGRSGLVRYGRYRRIGLLIGQYMASGDIEFAIRANQLRRNIAKPYRVLVSVEGRKLEWELSPLIAIENIESLVRQLSACTSAKQAQELVDRFSHWSHLR